MAAKENVAKLRSLVRSGYKLIHFSTLEESRAEEQLREVANAGDAGKKWRDYFAWTSTGGFRTADGKEADGAKDTDKPEKAFQWITDRERKKCASAMYVMKDLHPFIASKSSEGRFLTVRRLRDLVHELLPSYSAVILLSGKHLEIPPDLEKEVVIVDFDLPSLEELRAAFCALIQTHKTDPRVTIEVTEPDIDNFAKAAQGLTLVEAELAFGKAIIDDKRLDASDVRVIQEEKKQIVRKTGILTVEEAVDINDVGGLEILKKWLAKRKRIFSEEARRYGIPSPKGVLLTGVPGCGKSLCAKAMANHWGIPILRLDMGAIFGGLVGASEANMRTAISCAKAMAPCVLMIDEIEKGLAGMGGSGGDGGTSTRVFGTLLTWMNDKTEPVFVAATANQFDRLPPEMLRKGRFDELFFVDFPHAGEREKIFKIHLEKAMNRKDPRPPESELRGLLAAFDFGSEFTVTRTDKDGNSAALKGTVVQLSRNFTGSEIEEAVKTAQIAAFADGGRAFTTEDLATAISQTIPLMDTMAAEIERIRKRARECTVSASDAPRSETEAQVVASSKAEESVTQSSRQLPGGRAIDMN